MSSAQDGPSGETSPDGPIVSSGDPGPVGSGTSSEAPPLHPLPPMTVSAGGGAPQATVSTSAAAGPVTNAPAGPRRRARRLPPVAIVAAAVTLVVLAGAGLGLAFGADDPRAGGRPGDGAARKGAAAWSTQAAQRLTSLSALVYRGGFPVGGGTAQAQISMTKGGSGTGSLTIAGVTAELVVAGGGTYVRAGSAFWSAYGKAAGSPSDYAGQWTRVPAAAFGFELSTVLAPPSITRQLRDAAQAAGEQDVQGVTAHLLRTRPADYFVSAAAPHRLLRVRAPAGGGFQFEVSEQVDPAMVGAELRGRVAALGGAHDSAVRLDGGDLAFTNCNNNVKSCELSVDATGVRPGPATGATVRAVMTARITTQRRPLGSCTDVAPLGPQQRVTLRCKVTDAAWRTWMRQARDTPGRHPYTATARLFSRAVTSAEAREMLADLDRELQGG